MQDVVITGLGLVTPHGNSVASTWESMKQGESALARPTWFDPEKSRQLPYSTAEADFDFTDHPHVDDNRMGLFTQLAIQATSEALDDAGLDPESDQWSPPRAGTSIATCFGGVPQLTDAEIEMENGNRVSPYTLLNTMSNLGAGFVSIEYNAAGPNRAQSTACAASTQAIADAVDDIRLDRADIMIAGGAECPTASIRSTVLASFGALRALTQYDGPAEKASRPFDAERDGFVLGEGSGILILESRDHAEARGADIIAEVAGTGIAADADHPTGPREDAASLTRAIGDALDDAGIDAEAVDHVNAHATSTPDGDKHEALALNKTFDEIPPVTANKSQIGHAGGACGGIEAAVAALCIKHDLIPPTINYENPDPECDVPVVTEKTEQSVDRVLTNSSGFGGINVSLILEG